MSNFWYKYPYKSYESNDIKVTRIPEIDPKKPWQCPRCRGLLAKDGADAHCWVCGYFNFFYFDIKVLKFIAWVERREQVYGAPELLSNAEVKVIEDNRERANSYYSEHSEEKKARQKQDRVLNPEKTKAIEDRYYQTHKDEHYRRGREWREKNKEKVREYRRDYMRRRRNSPLASKPVAIGEPVAI